MDGQQNRWRCTLCGYVHQGAAPPDYCPVCGASASEFEPYEELKIEAAQPPVKRWRCLNCNYIHDGGDPPDRCSICGAETSRFEPMPEAELKGGGSAHTIKAVVIGGGIAGVSAAETIRNTSPGSSVTLITNEPCAPYYRLNLTRYLANEINSASLPIHPESWYGENQIRLITGQNIVDLATDGQLIKLDDGTTVAYDKLILAMGSHPFIPPITGTELGGVFTLRTVADADAPQRRQDSAGTRRIRQPCGPHHAQWPRLALELRPSRSPAIGDRSNWRD